MHMTMVVMRCVSVYTLMIIGGPEPGGGMHSLIHIHILHINVAVDMDDADVTVYMGCDSPHVRVTQTMITTTDNREGA